MTADNWTLRGASRGVGCRRGIVILSRVQGGLGYRGLGSRHSLDNFSASSLPTISVRSGLVEALGGPPGRW